MKVISVVILVILLVVCSLALYHNFRLNKSLSDFERKENERLKEALASEQKLMDQGLQEKYKANIDSYEALAKTLAIEKQRAKELEERIKAQKGAKN